jgi:glutaryl-CoA dehydrogenase
MEQVVLREEISYRRAPVLNANGLNMLGPVLMLYGTEEQKRQHLPGIAKAEVMWAQGYSEPNSGSDLASLQTRAVREGDEYVLNGSKRWIGNASFADLTIIWARDDDGNVGGFVVEKGTPGYRTEVMTGKVAKRAVWQADITLDNVRVRAGNRLAGARSFRDTSRVLTATRSGVAWEAAGHGMAAYEIALKYSQERVQFGQPLASFQLIQNKLASMLANVTTMQLLCLRLAQLQAAGEMTEGMARRVRCSAATASCWSIRLRATSPTSRRFSPTRAPTPSSR